MTTMAARAANPTSGGFKSAEAKRQTDTLINHAHTIINACGYSMSGSKVIRLVRQFQASVEQNGWAFWDFIANAMLLSDDQRRRAVGHPEIARVISYSDPTGETAVNNVMGKRHGKR